MEKLRKDIIESYLRHKVDIIVKEETASTNDDACSEGAVVFAVRQTAGRGQKTRKFYSGEGGIYMSVPLPMDAPWKFTIAAGTAVCKTLRAEGFDARIKWVNDIFVNGKKVCGILAEGKTQGNETKVALGIGLNYSSQIPPELSEIACSLFENSQGINRFAALLLDNLFDELASPSAQYYSEHCLTIGKKVRTDYGEGIAVAVCEDGSLLVDMGEIKKVFSGEAEILN